MQKPLMILIFLSCMVISSVAYAGWTKVTTTTNGVSIYIDFDRIRKTGIKTYFWKLVDYPKPKKMAGSLMFSNTEYLEAECGSFRSRYLVANVYPTPMAKGKPYETFNGQKEWDYPNPNTVGEIYLKAVCNR